MANAKIDFIVQNKEVHSSGIIKLTIGLINSTKQQLTTNELPIILNTIKNSYLMDSTIQMGFDYTLDFAMTAGFGFPDVLDCELLTEEDRNTI